MAITKTIKLFGEERKFQLFEGNKVATDSVLIDARSKTSLIDSASVLSAIFLSDKLAKKELTVALDISTLMGTTKKILTRQKIQLDTCSDKTLKPILEVIYNRLDLAYNKTRLNYTGWQYVAVTKGQYNMLLNEFLIAKKPTLNLTISSKRLLDTTLNITHSWKVESYYRYFQFADSFEEGIKPISFKTYLNTLNKNSLGESLEFSRKPEPVCPAFINYTGFSYLGNRYRKYHTVLFVNGENILLYLDRINLLRMSRKIDWVNSIKVASYHMQSIKFNLDELDEYYTRLLSILNIPVDRINYNVDLAESLLNIYGDIGWDVLASEIHITDSNIEDVEETVLIAKFLGYTDLADAIQARLDEGVIEEEFLEYEWEIEEDKYDDKD